MRGDDTPSSLKRGEGLRKSQIDLEIKRASSSNKAAGSAERPETVEQARDDDDDGIE